MSRQQLASAKDIVINFLRKKGCPPWGPLLVCPDASVPNLDDVAGVFCRRARGRWSDRLSTPGGLPGSVELELYFCDDPTTAPGDQKFPSARQFDLILCLADPGARQREGQAEPIPLDENEGAFDRLADFVLLTKTGRNNHAGENAGSVAAWQLLAHFLPAAGDRAIDGRDQFTTHIGTYNDVFDFERYLSNTLRQRLRHRYPTEVPREGLPNGPAITQPDHFLYRYGYSLNPEIRSYVNNWLWELRRRGRKERRRIAVLVFTLTLSLTTATRWRPFGCIVTGRQQTAKPSPRGGNMRLNGRCAWLSMHVLKLNDS